MRPFKPAPYLSLLLALLLAGCGTVRDSARERTLQVTLHSFENTVRWGDLGKMMTFLTPELKTKEEEASPKYDNIRVTEYRVVQAPIMAEEGSVATAKARIRYVLQDRQVERFLVDEQNWAFDEESGEWRRSSPLPKFK